MTAPFGVAIFVPMFVTGMTKKAATGMAVPAAAASALHSVALVQLICVIVGIVVCFLIRACTRRQKLPKSNSNFSTNQPHSVRYAQKGLSS